LPKVSRFGQWQRRRKTVRFIAFFVALAADAAAVAGTLKRNTDAPWPW